MVFCRTSVKPGRIARYHAYEMQGHGDDLKVTGLSRGSEVGVWQAWEEQHASVRRNTEKMSIDEQLANSLVYISC